MKSGKRRIEQVEGALTPQQAFLLWMEEPHQYETLGEYGRSLKEGPESAWPMVRLPKQVTQAVEQTMKGQPRNEIQRKRRTALRDVLFLFFLHQQVNRAFGEREQ